jgi:hypothetical protein
VVLLPAETVREVGVAEREKSHGVTLTGKACVVPRQPAAEVSVTVTFPLVVPNVTVIELLFGPAAPEVIVAPGGTVQA